MPRFKKKPGVVEATRWLKNGDHPQDESKKITHKGEPFLSEGKIVRRYRKPSCDGKKVCKICNQVMNIHGWIDTLQGGHMVCPGDWIITIHNGEYYPCKHDVFLKTYELY